MKIGFMQGRLSPIIDGKIQSFPWTNWQNEIQQASDNNLNFIEWTLDYKDLYLNPILTPEGVQEINKLKEKNNISIPSLTGDCFMQEPFWKASLDKRNKLQNDFINILYGCSKVNISIIVIPLVDNGTIENYEQETILHSFLSSNRELFKKLSIRVCFESDFSPKKLAKFISNYDHHTFGINYDTGNSAALGFNPIEEFDLYGKRIMNIHIKDRLYKGYTVPLGYGDTDFDTVFDLIKKYNYTGNLVLQTARSENHDHLAVLLKYFKEVKRLAIKYNLNLTSYNES